MSSRPAERRSTSSSFSPPDHKDSRTNTVTAANIRRILGADTRIAVTVHGKKKRERTDMLHWLVEQSYLPMFPRFMYNEANPSVPLTRHQLLHEARPILDREPEWIFILEGFMEDREHTVLKYIQPMNNQWELLLS